VAVSLLIYQAAYRIVRPALRKLTDVGAPEEALEQIRRVAGGTEGVERVHGLRTRYVGCSSLAADLHVEVASGMTVREGHDISEAVKRRLIAEGPDVVDVVVHLEPHEA
jgi:divalent metal cation (Fe/Co/Zn/Cd) transporter